jgi:hypothetical protein
MIYVAAYIALAIGFGAGWCCCALLRERDE